MLAQALTSIKNAIGGLSFAKSKSGQSLLEHSLIELDVFLQLAPILRDAKHYGLSDLEEAICSDGLPPGPRRRQGNGCLAGLCKLLRHRSMGFTHLSGAY